MPCDTIQTSSVKFQQDRTDLNLLTAAITAAGFTAVRRVDQRIFASGLNYSIETGVFTFTGLGQQEAQDMTAKIKRAYSAEVVKAQAKRFGWALKETGPFQWEVIKR